MNPTAHSFDVTTTDFQAQVMQVSHTQPVLVDFWATWCAPCKTLKPVLEQLAQDYGGAFVLAKVDIDKEAMLASHHGVRSVPTVLLYKNGQPVDGFTGAQPEGAIRALLAKHGIEPPPLSNLEEGLQALEVGQMDAAERLLAAALAEEPGNAQAAIGLARVAAVRGKVEEARQRLAALPAEVRERDVEAASLAAWLDLNDLIAQGPAPQALQDTLNRTPDDLDARYHLAIWRALGGDPDAAMEELLAIMRENRGFRDDGARKTLLRVFDFIGAEHPMVRRMRARLAMLLN